MNRRQFIASAGAVIVQPIIQILRDPRIDPRVGDVFYGTTPGGTTAKAILTSVDESKVAWTTHYPSGSNRHFSYHRSMWKQIVANRPPTKWVIA